VEEYFSAVLEGNLSAGEAAAINAHLESCPDCKEGFRRFEEAVGVLQAYEPPPVPPAFLDAVHEATTTDVRKKQRRWPLVLAWSVAAAASVVAVFALFSRPEPVMIEVPVEHRVVIEKKVPVPMPVRVPVGEGSLEVIREGSVLAARAGDLLDLREGDVIRAVPAPPPEVVPPPPVRVMVDFASLISALEQTTRRMVEAAGAMGTKPAALDPLPPSPAGVKPAPIHVADLVVPEQNPPVALVREANGVLVLETSGSPCEVIPELISLLEDSDPSVSAVAQGRLESIQDRLFKEHGIRPPMNPAPLKEVPSGGLEQLKRLFRKEEAPPQEKQLVDCWREWWTDNRAPISTLASNRNY